MTDSNIQLPGTTRDLDTMENHIKRAEGNAVHLYECSNMALTYMNGNVHPHQTTILDALRNDIPAMASCIRRLTTTLQSIATASPEVYASELREKAAEVISLEPSSHER